jgi:ADP-ribose pyrophosphatase YjhB (NUDIX family)
MTKLLYGNRIAKESKLRLGCSAVIFDEHRQKILLMRRTDNGQWCLPGGGMDAGENVAECSIREVWEETGLEVQVGRLLGIYSSPHRLIEYSDGNHYQIVGLTFEAEVTGGTLQTSDETLETGYFSNLEIAALDLMEHHRERIADAFASDGHPYIR